MLQACHFGCSYLAEESKGIALQCMALVGMCGGMHWAGDHLQERIVDNLAIACAEKHCYRGQ